MRPRFKILIITLALLTVLSFIGLPSAASQMPKATDIPTMPIVPILAADDDDGGIFDGLFKGVTDAINGLGKWFEDLWDNIGKGFDTLGDKIKGLGTDIGEWFKSLGSNISGIGDMIKDYFDSTFDRFISSVTSALFPYGGQTGMLEIIKAGGSTYASDALNTTINALYEVFYVPGVVVMLFCFIYAVAKGFYTLDFSGKNSIVQPAIGMIITLIAFTLAKEVMTLLFTFSLDLTKTVVEKGMNGTIQSTLDKFTSVLNPTEQLGYFILSGILQLILMVNVAKIALMQSIAPFFIGFAPAENSRRIMINLLKEYGKCCLVPPVTAAYALIMFCIMDSTWGVLSSIVIGFSLFTMASKTLDKILN